MRLLHERGVWAFQCWQKQFWRAIRVSWALPRRRVDFKRLDRQVWSVPSNLRCTLPIDPCQRILRRSEILGARIWMAFHNVLAGFGTRADPNHPFHGALRRERRLAIAHQQHPKLLQSGATTRGKPLHSQDGKIPPGSRINIKENTNWQRHIQVDRYEPTSGKYWPTRIAAIEQISAFTRSKQRNKAKSKGRGNVELDKSEGLRLAHVSGQAGGEGQSIVWHCPWTWTETRVGTKHQRDHAAGGSQPFQYYHE